MVKISQKRLMLLNGCIMLRKEDEIKGAIGMRKKRGVQGICFILALVVGEEEGSL